MPIFITGIKGSRAGSRIRGDMRLGRLAVLMRGEGGRGVIGRGRERRVFRIR